MDLRTPALLVATVAVLAGCSSNGGEDSPVVTAPTTASAPAPAPTTASPTPSPRPRPTTASPKPGQETAPPLGRPACAGKALTVTDADTLVDPSYSKEVYVVRTTGPECELQGYPTVQATGVATRHGGFGLPPERPQAVTLSRATSLSFLISSPRSGSCRDVPSISVTLPGTTTAHRVSTSLRVCGPAVGLSPVHRQGESD